MKLWRLSPSDPQLEEMQIFQDICDALSDGKLVAIPTETVYGLAADATNGKACAGIYEAKGRPSFNPLISHIDSLEAAQTHAFFDDRALKLATEFWPGPLTLVLPKLPTSPVSDLAVAGLETIALRVPRSAVMRALCKRTGLPLAAPSANLSGRISGTTATDVINDLKDHLSYVIDSGATPVGVESTIVSLVSERPTLLRPGGLAREDIEAVLGEPLARAGTDDSAPMAPGMLTSHYAPNSHIRLNADYVTESEALITFGTDLPKGADKAARLVSLSDSMDLTEAAARLFTALRLADLGRNRKIAVMPIPHHGLGEAINDRLARAAAPRE
ncbi:Threonylcarbamoyl-AMP synthase [Pseudovibrio axinellae]|uniref:Threonylcarbamoyl-AMP synthase n=1 Tax=Pseudovibrio axinellae TaxID=989403 RepID=A0A165YHZ3_9HYPH|nr:L-threonylcarbamoyladenylate synthase [Pseudovibrio axinellae]KZL18857.1 Threonylcarbamoyl-AMP synthase [Pseudovibrio axinellae]SEP90089.1 translation factor SUA5 [Pseudovibrio axinellae]